MTGNGHLVTTRAAACPLHDEAVTKTPASVAIEYGDTSYAILPQRACAIVVVSGEIDLYSAAGLRAALDTAAMVSDQLIIDMSELRFIDSSGLSVLLRADRHGRQRSVSLIRPPLMMRKLLQLTGLGDVMTVYVTREEAVDALGPGPSSDACDH